MVFFLYEMKKIQTQVVVESANSKQLYKVYKVYYNISQNKNTSHLIYAKLTVKLVFEVGKLVEAAAS